MHTNALYIPRAEQMSDEFNYIILTRAHVFCVYYSRLLRTGIIYQGIVNPKRRPMLKSNLLNFYQFATESARTKKIFFIFVFFLILHFGQVRALRQNPQKKSFSSSHDLRRDAMND